MAAIRHIDFEAPPGEVTALIGPNGSGKTTLLLILASLLAPDDGSLTVGGVDPQVDSNAVRRKVGWMPDTLGVWESLKATEILTTMGALYGMVPGEREARAAELLAAVRLSEYADQPARVLSRGQQQRLSLARALIHDPEVLLLDEPASGLDPGSRVELRTLLRRLAGEGKTIVVSSHVLSELDEIADRAVFVNRGESVKSQSLDEAGTQVRRYCIQAEPMEPLADALTSHGVEFEARGDSRRAEYQVLLNSTEQAAWLLRTLVMADVVITAFAPAGGALEETYMSLETDRQ
ncbi:ABC transporter ATP-binding protein [Arthrobacter sp. H5]|uniref:ABC transporter ATP-binding protein n=1 Tax=Arthrobacter sp. H5 TaxID=1267973 RepID=UPI0031B82044